MPLTRDEIEKRITDSYELPNRVVELVPQPMVTVRTSTYQHSNYIKDCIEGVLMQKTTFPIEFIIGEDFSTDGTRQIVFEYAQKYPGIIRVITADYNVGSKANGTRCIRASRGKYMALCEGDDYWTDPYKLQKQINFLENNPGYTLCVGGYQKKYVQSGKVEDVIEIPTGFTPDNSGYTFTLETTMKRWLTKTLTATFVNDSAIISQVLKYKYSRDVNLVYHLLKNGKKGFYFTDVLGTYRIHSGGVHSMTSTETKYTVAYNLYKELYSFNKDEYSRVKYLYSFCRYFNYELYKIGSKKKNYKKVKTYLEVVFLARTFPEVSRLFLSLFPPNIKTKIMFFASNLLK